MAELTEAYRSGAISPVEVARAALERAATIQENYNAFTFLDWEGALAAAHASEARWRASGPLSVVDGIPTTLKDIVHVKGWTVRYGSQVTATSPWPADAPAVARLRAGGAVLIAQTTTPEFGWKAVTDNRKDGVARNPWDNAKTPGGSSGGAAVAAATGAGVLHLGTDGGGSIRVPASFTGVVGHKPSFGRVATYPASSFGTLAHTGPLARNVEDVTAMLNVMAGRDFRDWTQPPLRFRDVAVRPVDWSGKQVAYWKTPCVGGVDQSVANSVESVLKDLELAGARITEIRLPDQGALLEIFCRHWYVGAANRLSAIDPGDHDALDPGLLKAAQIGQRYTAVEHKQAEVQRAQYGAQMDVLLGEFDFVISPTVAIPPFEVGRDFPGGGGYENWIEWASFTFPINLSQQPACSVPCGLTADGLPVGLQIIGARGDDAGVLNAALTHQLTYPGRYLGCAPHALARPPIKSI